MPMLDMRVLENLPQHIYVFAVILGVLTLAFLAFFVVPAIAVSWRLSRVTTKLRKLEGKPNANLDELFKGGGILEHLWREYSHTLHEQIEPNPEAGEPRVRWRSTVPAEALFRPEIIVDTPLRTEFFRHLPGIFTGVGIIGTFFGLLMGLRAFQVSENPIVVRDSLNNLLHGVWEAFLVSAVAIALAMILTLVEKLLIARLNAKVERLVQVLDSLFEAGAGEEYLARLVKASESSAVQNHALQDVLVAELRQLNEKQIAAANAASTALGERIVRGIETSLKAPMTEMSEALRGLRTDEWVAVQGLLTDVLGAFS
ncbi:MAG TPA: tellurium resistance protein TerC, partial [Burkholderiales bacterium]|nr:tellurium resistance protein TerC [Burkholderiales bacterium]